MTPRGAGSITRRAAALFRALDAGTPGSAARALRGLPVVITHVKPSFRRGESPHERSARELRDANRYGVRFVLATQRETLAF